MKKMVISVITLLLMSGAAFAQRDLDCYPVFQGKVVPDRLMVVTEVRGSSLSTYKLDFYRGISFQVDRELAGKVAALVEADAAATESAETEKVGGLLTYALVQPSSKGKTRRYLCYQARPDGELWKITLLYLEGPATLDDLRKMFEKQ